MTKNTIEEHDVVGYEPPGCRRRGPLGPTTHSTELAKSSAPSENHTINKTKYRRGAIFQTGSGEVRTVQHYILAATGGNREHAFISIEYGNRWNNAESLPNVGYAGWTVNELKPIIGSGSRLKGELPTRWKFVGYANELNDSLPIISAAIKQGLYEDLKNKDSVINRLNAISAAALAGERAIKQGLYEDLKNKDSVISKLNAVRLDTEDLYQKAKSRNSELELMMAIDLEDISTVDMHNSHDALENFEKLQKQVAKDLTKTGETNSCTDSICRTRLESAKIANQFEADREEIRYKRSVSLHSYWSKVMTHAIWACALTNLIYQIS